MRMGMRMRMRMIRIYRSGVGGAECQWGVAPYIYKSYTFHKLFKCLPVARKHKKSNIIIDYYTAIFHKRYPRYKTYLFVRSVRCCNPLGIVLLYRLFSHLSSPK